MQRIVIFLIILLAFVLGFQYFSQRSENSPSNVRFKKIEKQTQCRRVTVKELDDWFDSNHRNEISKIIHQTWKNQTLRPKQKKWSDTWCNQYTDWVYHLWTDQENDDFVRKKFPWFYPTYSKLSPGILRADSIRYLYMSHYGGIYVRFFSFYFHSINECHLILVILIG